MFRDRTEAGRMLAAELKRMIEADPTLADPVVLALPRGGVPVAFEIARALDAPLDLIFVRKIGAPFQPELAVGAVADGAAPQMVVNPMVLRATGMTEEELDAAKARALAEIDRRRGAYLRGRAPVAATGRVAIVADDGVATGATTRAALRAVRAQRPKALILATPLAPRDVLPELRREVDYLVCLQTPEPFWAIGGHYEDFPQLEDAEVVALMDAAAGFGRQSGTVTR
jgi:putative phosphoribosyl transferase